MCIQTHVTYSCGLLHMDKQRYDDQLEPIYNSSVQGEQFHQDLKITKGDGTNI